MGFNKKDLISIGDLTASDIRDFINTAAEFKKISQKDIKKVPTLRGKTVINIFYEPSTRTRSSFEIAQKRLSADSLSIAVSQSSVVKGESLRDTILNLESMNPDAFVVRHPESGAANFISRWTDASVLNAGDGINEHPTQCLLDIMTVMEKKKTVKGLKVSIIGDIYHSRVARSDMHGFSKLGASVFIYGPHSLLPRYPLPANTRIAQNIEEAISGADVIIMLRIQKERASYYFIPSIEEYRSFFQLTPELLSMAGKDAIVLHPGPVNRDVEIAGSIIDGGRTEIFRQVENGVAVRMACLYILLGHQRGN